MSAHPRIFPDAARVRRPGCWRPPDQGRRTGRGSRTVATCRGLKTVVEAAGREVTVSDPDKVFFPRTGHTKIDLVRYYLAAADGAVHGVDGRPMALKRFVNGAEGEPFFQKRAPKSRPDSIETVELRFPSGRTASEVVVRRRSPADLGGQSGLY